MPSRVRPSNEQRGYGVTHRRTVEYWRPLVRAGMVRCPYCGEVIRGAFHLGHSDDRRSYIGPTCPKCNLREAGLNQVVLDLRGVRFIDSTGLRLILELDAAARADSHQLRMIRGSDVVHRIFEVTQVADRLYFVDP